MRFASDLCRFTSCEDAKESPAARFSDDILFELRRFGDRSEGTAQGADSGRDLVVSTGRNYSRWVCRATKLQRRFPDRAKLGDVLKPVALHHRVPRIVSPCKVQQSKAKLTKGTEVAPNSATVASGGFEGLRWPPPQKPLVWAKSELFCLAW